MEHKHTPGPALMRAARMACEIVAAGPFSPIVIQPYGPLIGGECGFVLGRPIECGGGHGITWTHRATKTAGDPA